MPILYYGDNLSVLEKLPANSVDLIYLDPPFNSDRTYNVIDANSDVQKEAFTDTWNWSSLTEESLAWLFKNHRASYTLLHAIRVFSEDSVPYLSVMAVRLAACWRLVRETGCVVFHCDDHESHRLRLLMDCVFGSKNFINEVIWKRSTSHNKLSKRFGRIHDSILIYQRSDLFSPIVPRSEAKNTRIDIHGEYRSAPLTGPQPRNGDSGKAWMNYDPTAKGKHWAVPGYDTQPRLWEIAGITREQLEEMTLHQKLDALYEHQLVIASSLPSLPSYKNYTDVGGPCQDLWIDIGTLAVKNGTGYNTEKPPKLMERIIEYATKPGHVVLDPFMGSGTTVVAAQKLRRDWIGVDINVECIAYVKNRLFIETGLTTENYGVKGIPNDLTSARLLAKDDHYMFQKWIVDDCLKGTVGQRGADGGSDGVIQLRSGQIVIVSVKGGASGVTLDQVRALVTVQKAKGAAYAIFVAFDPPTKDMTKVISQNQGMCYCTVNDLLENRIPSFLDNIHSGIKPMIYKERTASLEWMFDKFEGEYE